MRIHGSGHPFGIGRQLGAPANPMQMMQLLQTMMTVMMSLMQSTMGGGMGQGLGQGGTFSPYMNPNFGGGGCASCGSHGGGMPSFQGFSGGSQPSSGGSPTTGRRDHSYIPGGADLNGAANNGLIGRGAGSSTVDWANQYLGVSEQNNPGQVRKFSRGKWQAWCADFVSQAYKNTPGGSPFGHQSSVAGILAWSRKNGRFFGAQSASANPRMLQVGDIAIWKSGGKSHVGLVTGINKDGTFNTVEGNTGDAVRRKTHSFGKGLTGFARPRGQMPR